MFLIDFIFQDWVVIAAVVALAGIGFQVLAMNDFRMAKICFLMAAVCAIGGVIKWEITTARNNEARISVGVLCFTIIGILIVGSWRYVNRKREARTLAIGNLKQRTDDLADEILFDLFINGWQRGVIISNNHQWKLKLIRIKELPSDDNGIRKWQEARSQHFKYTFYDDVVALRDEFAQFHTRNKFLDDFITEYNEQQKDYIGALQIQEIAQQLKTMAAE